jgi:predicted MFS family arabinose efflux permease
MELQPTLAGDSDARAQPLIGQLEVSTDHKLSRYTWYVIGLLTVVSIFSYIDRMALAALAPSIKRDLGLSDSELGLLTGLAFSVFYAICGIPIARWADRGVRVHILSIALAAWSVMTALSGAAQGFWNMFLCRVGIGAGEAGCLPSAQSIICDYVPKKMRPGIFAVHNVGNYLGMMLGLGLAGWLALLVGWRLTFVLLGLPGLVLALILWSTLIEPARGSLDEPNKTTEAKRDFGATIRVLLKCKPYRLLLAFYVVNGFVQYGLIQWWPSFYSRSYDIGISSIGVYLGLAVGGSAATGSLVGGLVAHSLANRTSGAPLIVGASVTMLALPAAMGSVLVSRLELSVALVSLSAFCWSVSNGPVIATAASVVSPTMRATSLSIIIFATSVVGFGLGPLSVGLLSDFLQPQLGQQALRYALLLPASLLPVMAAVLCAAAKSVNGSRESTE